MALTLNSSPLAIARAHESHEDRTSGDGEECPECGEHSLETESGGSRRGRWYKVECSECGYAHDDVDIYED